MILKKKCCLTCACYLCPDSKGKLCGPCGDYTPLVFDNGNIEHRDSVIIELYGLDALRDLYDEDEFEEYYGLLVEEKETALGLDRQGRLDDSDRKQFEEVFGPTDWPSKRLADFGKEP
ncbi:hypothetical protein PED39_02065 [Methanomassiliicoccales archaeon LGM-RCC1]|nr:hypothetical protein PED39_02065 [Methanomassiliicoccales archaeon LGM-RCC1]